MKIDHKSSLVHFEKYSDIYAGLVSILMNLMLIINLFENSVSLLFGFLFYIFCGLYIFGAGSRELRRKNTRGYFIFFLFYFIPYFFSGVFCLYFALFNNA